MIVWIQLRTDQFMLRAQREPLDLRPESQRYWTGNAWSQSPADAKLFDRRRTASECRTVSCLSEQVPPEWHS